MTHDRPPGPRATQTVVDTLSVVAWMVAVISLFALAGVEGHESLFVGATGAALLVIAIRWVQTGGELVSISDLPAGRDD